MGAEALVVFVGEERCALPMERVTEVRAHTGATRIPGAPAWICGLVDQEGAPVELFDAAQRLGLGSGRGTRPCVVFFDRMAMLVDDVDRLIELRPVDEPGPPRRSAGFQPAAPPPSRRHGRQDAGVAAGKMPALRSAGAPEWRDDLVAGMIEDGGAALPLIDVDAFFAAAEEGA